MSGHEYDGIGERIRLLRKELDLTQTQFSRILLVSNALVACLESEKRAANERTIKLICDSFNVNREWLKTGNGAIFLENRESKNTKLLALFSQLKPRYQDYVIDAIDRFLKLDDSL